jgi:hypothetical protein
MLEIENYLRLLLKDTAMPQITFKCSKYPFSKPL